MSQPIVVFDDHEECEKRAAVVAEALVRVTAERDDFQATLTALRRCCELGATRTHQIETAAILALLDGVPDVVSEWDLDSALAARDEAQRRQRRYKAAWESASRRAAWQRRFWKGLHDRVAAHADAVTGDLVRVTKERDSAYKQRDELEIEANTLNQLLFGVENERDRYRAERDEARDEVVRLGRERDSWKTYAEDVRKRLRRERDEARELVTKRDVELERLRTIIGELGAAEAAEPPEGIEALRPGFPPCGRVGLHNCDGEWKNHDHAGDQP